MRNNKSVPTFGIRKDSNGNLQLESSQSQLMEYGATGGATLENGNLLVNGNSGTYEYYIEDLQSGNTATGTHNLNTATDVESVYLMSASRPSDLSNWITGGSSGMAMRWDQIRIKE